MGESVSEGTVARWLKSVGDSLAAGEPVVEVTTDKVDVEVPAPADGRLTEIRAAEGETVAVGATLGTMVEAQMVPDGAIPSGPVARPSAPAQPAAPTSVAAPPARMAAPPEPGLAERLLGPSPLARRAAAIRGLSADALVAGAGPRSAPAPPEGEPTTLLRGPAGALVDHMEASRDIPTATSFRTFPVATLEARRIQLNRAIGESGRGGKVSYTHLIGFAVARAAAEHRPMTASFARDPMGAPVRVDSGVHLGLAVDSSRRDGSRFLVVPVIRNAQTLNFAQFRDEYERLVERARAGTLTPDEMRGATITLTNPGGIGTMASVPRLMAGQGTIVAVGAIGYPPEWRTVSEARIRELGISRVMTVTSTYDHRIIQGAQSGEYLGRIEALLDGADNFYSDIFASLGHAAPSLADATAPAAVAVPEPTPRSAPATDSHELLAAMSAAMSVIKAHRTHGHLGAHLDPLGTPPIGDPAIEPETVNLTPALMARVPAEALRVYVPGRTLAEVLPNLRRTYCGTIAYEIEHISSHEQRVWLREHIESGAYRLPIPREERVRLLRALTKVEAMERYLRRTFLGQKTFSSEGVDVMVPMLETLVTMFAEEGISQVVLGMAHRGRLATIAHVVGAGYEAVLGAFERAEQRRPVGITTSDPTGDVKYHLGATGTYVTDSGRPITVRLLPNPSHLEAVDGVVEGWTRAEQTRRDGPQAYVDPQSAVALLVHGDAAFPGQGVVAEVLNLQSLQGYATGGTIHIIANNQIGFTTDPTDGRSTRYASDLAKGFDIPIVHVNADDVEACIAAVRLAHDFRHTYGRDVVIDLIGYRRFGHNETDEPAYTQPTMYQKIREHPTVRRVFADALVRDGVISEAEVEAMAEEAYAEVGETHKRIRASVASASTENGGEKRNLAIDPEHRGLPTAVAADVLLSLGEQLTTVPDEFRVNAKFVKQLERRRTSLTQGGIDWGTAESLAIAALLLEGHPVRMTGQDTERGTFSQRHMALHDEMSGASHVPMQHVVGAKASFELHNSPLSEVACLAFEYGYSAATPDTLVLWEAQFGDFVNNAQMVVDQFVSSGTAKWNQQSRLTLLLPHGYEGAGPEHSSARLERFLQLSAHSNLRVANCSTAAQYFHLLRSQSLSSPPRPLVIMTPKSLLRLRESCSTLEELSTGHFRPVIDDAMVADRRGEVTTLLLCSGKVYYDLVLHEMRQEATDLAIARVELLDPLPIEEILDAIRGYPRLEQIFWVQEEPSNMGAWLHLTRPIGRRRPYEIRWDYIGRPRRASPSEGFMGSHHLEQERVVTTALSTSRVVQARLAAASGGAEPGR